jgi:predicted aldo/keto reductase-like oxidoreductase
VGGKRQNLEKYKTGNISIFQAMLKWALENQEISSVVTEILTFQQMEEDLAIVGQSLSEEERKTLYSFVAQNSKDYCHMCSRCENSCPEGIRTTEILRCLAYFESYGKTLKARQAYSRLPSRVTVEACQDCGLCEARCPYNVSVRARINQAHTLFS